MRKSLVVLLFVAIVLSIVSLVACNTEVPEETGLAQVTFAPAVPKSLNQDGKAQVVSAKVTDFKWQYYCSEQDFTLSDNLDWKNFFEDFDSTSPTNGLGSIKNLNKNHDYYFALRAYEDSLLVWEGKTPSSTKLAARNTTVSITVYSVGQGSIYFNFTAPVASDWISEPDKFVVSWTAMSDKNTSGTNTYEATLNDDGDEFVVNTVSSNKPIVLTAGTYLFTVKQQTYNEDTEEYEDVSGRKQVLIVDAQSGVDTVIAGSLDSTSYQVFNYEAGGDVEDEFGMEIEWMNANVSATDLYPISIQRTSYSSSEAVIQNYWPTKNGINHVVNINHGEWVRIVFTSATSNLKIYVNGDYVNTTSSNMYHNEEFNRDFYKKEVDDSFEQDSSTDTYLNGFYFGDNAKTINAFAKKGVDYILTFVDGAISNSFTIHGTTGYVDTTTIKLSLNSYTGSSGDLEIDLPSTYQEALEICDFDVKLKNGIESTPMHAKIVPYYIRDIEYAALTLDRDNYQSKYLFTVNSFFTYGTNCLQKTYTTYTDFNHEEKKSYYRIRENHLTEVGYSGIVTASSAKIRTSSTDDGIYELVPFTELNVSKELGLRLGNGDTSHSHRYILVSNTDTTVVQATPISYNTDYDKDPYDYNLTMLKKGEAWLTFQVIDDGQILKVKVMGPANEVTFDANNGSNVTKDYVLEGNKVTKPANPSKTGFVFAGWTTDSDVYTTSTVYDFNAAVTENLSLNAIWVDPLHLVPTYVDNTRTKGISTWTNAIIPTSFTDKVKFISSDDETLGSDNTTSWYILNNTVTISNRIVCKGEVNLILKDNCILTASNGITVSGDNNSLTIYAQSTTDTDINKMGKLIANGNEKIAAIGGGDGENGNNITINGGTVIATGGKYASGIGGGNGGKGNNITVNGGIVTATGGFNGAGIGGGDDNGAFGSDIVINGGTVTATGGNYGAGIGGGYHGQGNNIIINEGTVTANGGKSSSGIGGGVGGDGRTITINGGTVTATGGEDGAGIGGGYLGFGVGITVNGGTITANGGQSASGIGGGQGKSGGSIIVSTSYLVKADGNNPPTTIITNGGSDISEELGGKRYCTIALQKEPL